MEQPAYKHPIISGAEEGFSIKVSLFIFCPFSLPLRFFFFRQDQTPAPPPPPPLRVAGALLPRERRACDSPGLSPAPWLCLKTEQCMLGQASVSEPSVTWWDGTGG